MGNYYISDLFINFILGVGHLMYMPYTCACTCIGTRPLRGDGDVHGDGKVKHSIVFGLKVMKYQSLRVFCLTIVFM